MKKFLTNIAIFALIVITAVSSYYYSPIWIDFSKSVSDYPIGNIECPEGYVRMECKKGSMADFLRNLPLKSADVPLTLWKGHFTDSDTVVHYCHRVVDVPLLSKYEQCADVCIHLRADYLYEKRQYFKIHFEDTRRNVMRYYYGNCDTLYHDYLRNTIEWANTESLINEMPQRRLEDVQPGDVFIYDYKSRTDKKYGHAIMVADVAIDNKTGEKLIMLVQGSTPACTIHIMKNLFEPGISPWFRLDTNAKDIDFGFAKYKGNELRYFD